MAHLQFSSPPSYCSQFSLFPIGVRKYLTPPCGMSGSSVTYLVSSQFATSKSSLQIIKVSARFVRIHVRACAHASGVFLLVGGDDPNATKPAG